MIIEGLQKRNNIGDVVADHDIALWDVIGDVRPIAQIFVMDDTSVNRAVGELVEHRLLVVNGNDGTGGWGYRECGPAATRSNIEHARSGGQPFARPPMGW